MRKKIILMISIIFILIILIFVIIRNYNTDDIPKVYIEGDISKMTTKKDERKIKIIYKSKDLKFESYALIKIQGSSSLYFEKKNYNIKLYDDESFENKFKIDVGYGELNKYCLKANWSDKTHSRNIVTARIMSDIQNKYNLFMDTPNNGLIDGYPIELYENGKFLGLYTWNIPKDESMFNLDEDNPNHIALSGVDYTEATNFNQKATFEKEIKRWKDIPGFNLNQIEAFLNTRLPHIDQYMNDLANGMIK